MPGKLIYIVAGEPSGDMLGGKLMAAIKKQSGDDIKFAGVGGEKMQEHGFTSLFPMSELSLIGFSEIIPHAPNIFRRLSQTVSDIKRLKPDAVVTIDSPGFNFRLAKKLKGSGIKLVHYVAPTVWAYRPERAKLVANLFDHIMVLLPFEPPYFEKAGIGCTFVGHPVVEGWDDKGNGRAFREKNHIPADAPVICVSPGSRPGEITRHLPILSETVAILAKMDPKIRAVVPTVSSVSQQIREEVAKWPIPAVIVDKSSEKKDAFAACNVALAKSGTVTLELALAEVPMVVNYRVSAISAWLMRRMIMVRFVNLINIINEKEVIPELLQEFCKPQILADAVNHLINDPEECARQVAGSKAALLKLGLGQQITPSEKAAKVVLEIIKSV